jgi:hypothetical protein
VTVGRVGADQDDHVGVLDGIEILGAGRGAESLAKAIAGGRMADAGASVDIVVAEAGTDQLLYQEGFLVGAARRGDAADRALAVLELQPAEFLGDMGEGFFPGDFAPGISDLLAHHRIEYAVLVGGVAPGEAALDAGMAAIGLAVLPRHHADDFLAAHFRLERAADAAIGAGRNHRMLGLADLDHGFFLQRRRRAGLHAGAAGDALGIHEALVHAGRDAAFEPPALDGQRECALHFLAGAHATRADNALGRIIGEIRIALVLRHEFRIGLAVLPRLDMVLAVIAVAHIAQADGAGHVLQLAIAIGSTGQAVERVIGNVKLHHAAADVLQASGLGVDHHALGHRRGAGGGRAVAALDLDQAEPAGAEGVDHVGGAELRHLDAGLHRGAHHRSAFRYFDGVAVDDEPDGLFGLRGRGAVVNFLDQRHRVHSAAWDIWAGRKSSGKCVSALITG